MLSIATLKGSQPVTRPVWELSSITYIIGNLKHLNVICRLFGLSSCRDGFLEATGDLSP